KELLEMQGKSKQVIQEREKKLQELRKSVETHKHSAERAVKETEDIFTELIKSIERSRSKLTELIRAQEKAAVSQAEDVMKKLQKEIAELKKKDMEMENLSYTEDPIRYLQGFQSVLTSAGPPTLSSFTLCPCPTFENVIKSVSQMRNKLEENCAIEFKKISSRVWSAQLISRPRLSFACGSTPEPQSTETLRFIQTVPPALPESAPVSTPNPQSTGTFAAPRARTSMLLNPRKMPLAPRARTSTLWDPKEVPFAASRDRMSTLWNPSEKP
ncbi:E3 ubiquitin/ISG15 ligase TRIM25-like, partial [Clarias magur]